jgi:two component transcriptional regulator, luxR family
MKVLVVDDNPIVRAGLAAVLSRIANVSEVLEAENAFTALEMAARHSPDVILLDVLMPPGRTGVDILPELPQSASVIMLTSTQDSSIVRLALERGARGYLVHGQLGSNEISGAIETCRNGGLVLGQEAADVVLYDPKQDGHNPLLSELSEREAEILSLAAEGMTNHEIAAQLFLSERTVKNYINATYPKIGVHDRSEAVAAWHRAATGRR